jgi:hypothetical protein
MPVPFGRLSLETTLRSKPQAPKIWRFRQVHMQHNYPIAYPICLRWGEVAGFRIGIGIGIGTLEGYRKIPNPVAFATASPRPWTPSLP